MPSHLIAFSMGRNISAVRCCRKSAAYHVAYAEVKKRRNARSRRYSRPVWGLQGGWALVQSMRHQHRKGHVSE